jgi:hypothetical protein
MTARYRCFRPVNEIWDPLLPGAVHAAEEATPRLDAVAQDAAPAVRAHGGQKVDRALERVENVRVTLVKGDLESLVVVVSAALTDRHEPPPIRGVERGSGSTGELDAQSASRAGLMPDQIRRATTRRDAP